MQADYVIVGAGSAGCVLAERLSAGGAEVVLLEAGGKDTNPLIHVPAGVLKLITHPVVNWNYYTEPDEKTGNRAFHCPRGKVLGGSSSINGMLFIRGNAADFDSWAQMGARGWSYDDVKQHFKSIERYGPGDPGERGKSGPILVEDYRTVLPLTHRFVEAAQQAGHAFARDLSGRPPAEGVGYSQMSRNGRFRGSTARTFLRDARGRTNLRVVTDAHATGLTFDGRRCTGVAFRQRGRDRQVTAAREVIVSGGTVNSPHLLHISGVGPAERLKEIGVEVRHDLPGVGMNYSDHYTVRISHRVRGQQSINQLARGWRLVREMARFALLGNGALTFGVSSAQCYTRSREGLASPDIQLLFTPASFDEDDFGRLEQEPGMSVAVSIARPSSRGEIVAVSPDPVHAAGDPPEHAGRPRRPAGCRGGSPPGARDLRPAGLRGHHPGRDFAGAAGGRQGGAGGLRALHRPDDLPHGRHLPHGRGPDGGGRFAPARTRAGRAPGDRRLGHAHSHHRQHQRPHHHDRRKGRGDDSGG